MSEKKLSEEMKERLELPFKVTGLDYAEAYMKVQVLECRLAESADREQSLMLQLGERDKSLAKAEKDSEKWRQLKTLWNLDDKVKIKRDFMITTDKDLAIIGLYRRIEKLQDRLRAASDEFKRVRYSLENCKHCVTIIEALEHLKSAEAALQEAEG